MAWPQFSLLAAAILLGGQGSPPQTGIGVERVEWLMGCWETASPQRTVEEHRLPPRGGTMIGLGRTVREGRTTEYELVVLRPQDRRLAYESLTLAAAARAVFACATPRRWRKRRGGRGDESRSFRPVSWIETGVRLGYRVLASRVRRRADFVNRVHC